MSEITFISRYDVFGPPSGCDGQCEGTQWVPVEKDTPDDAEGPWHQLWEAAEAKLATDDGWHFVPCPKCQSAKALELLGDRNP